MSEDIQELSLELDDICKDAANVMAEVNRRYGRILVTGVVVSAWGKVTVHGVDKKGRMNQHSGEVALDAPNPGTDMECRERAREVVEWAVRTVNEDEEKTGW